MEKVLNSMPNGEKIHASRILELNADHKIMQALERVADDEAKLGVYADLLYTQAQLIDGIAPEDPVAFSQAICELM